MKIKDVLQQKDSLLGKEVTIEAVLVVGSNTNFLTINSADKTKDQERILVEQSDLEEKLLEGVPCYVGGHLYNDDVLVSGRLTKSTNDLFPISLTNVKSLVVKRDDETYSLSF